MKTLIPIIILLLSLQSCCPKKEFHTSKMNLRQLVQETKVTEQKHASFFLFMGSYSSNTSEKTLVRMFANVGPYYQNFDVPLYNVRVNIDNSLEVPSLEIIAQLPRTRGFINCPEFSNKEVIELAADHWNDYYVVIHCPEQYLPENLNPIGL